MDEAIPPWFPAWCIQFSEPISDSRITAAMLLQNRKHERWLLLGYPAAVSERHLWATWLALRERVNAEKMISNSLDGEFLRLIAGTHQMNVAFNRAGVKPGDDKAWLIRLPEWDEELSAEIELPYYNGDYDESAYELMSWLEAELLPERPMPTLDALERLEINYDSNNQELQIEQLLLTSTAIVDID
jgi:tRNA threonylcarbamoyladenosine modification (KEOPS) complex Cgi121 subunit